MFFDDRKDEDSMLKYAWVMGLEWEDYDDFQRKYGMNNNPEAWAKLWSYLIRFDDVGLMLERGVLHIEDVYELHGRGFSSLWHKYKPIIEEERRRSDPKTMDWFEYFFTELEKEGERRGDIRS